MLPWQHVKFFPTDNSMTGKSVTEYASLQPHFSEMQNNKSGYFVADVAGEKTIIAYDTVEGPNWILALAVPESTVLASMTTMKWMFLIVTLVGLALVMLVTHQFALRIVAPVQTLQAQAGEITARIESIQHDTDQAVASMQQGTERVKSGMASIREVGTEFGDIMAQIGQTKDDMLGISEAVQQGASTEEIAAASRSLAGLAEELQTAAKKFKV